MTIFFQKHRSTLAMCEKKPSPSAADSSCGTPSSLPAVLSKLDLVFFSLLQIVTLPDIEAMQFSGTSMVFYWTLAFVAFSIPCTYICNWLLRQAPASVPFYVWILRFVNGRWRSFLLFLMWWAGVISILSVLGLCLSLLQPILSIGADDLAGQSLLFAGLLIAGCLLLCLPLSLLRYVLSGLALLYLAFFVLLIIAALVWVRAGQETLSVIPHAIPGHLPATFSWPLFGLAVFSLLGINFLLFLDGEMRGKSRCLRHPAAPLWGNSLLVLLVLVSSTLALLLIEPTALAVKYGSPLQAIRLVFGPETALVAQCLLVLCNFGMAVEYLLVLSRVLLLCPRLGYVPRSLAQLTRTGVPFRAILTQFVLIVLGALSLFVAVPGLLKTLSSTILFANLTIDDQFCLMSSVGAILWTTFTILTFVFAFWIYAKKSRRSSMPLRERILVPTLCVSGLPALLICAVSPLAPEWPAFFLSHNQWFLQVLLGLACSILLAWLVSEFPRRSALLREQHLLLRREKELREELQRTYARECHLHTRLRDAYDELNVLYREQEQAAVTDYVTGLPNHRACMQRLDEGIARCQSELCSCLVLFIDLDHFKAINDTWGHQAGDSILRQVAQRLRDALHPDDFVGRYGGEEFALLLARTTLSDIRREAIRLHQVIRDKPCEWRGEEQESRMIPVTASIGVAAYGIHGTRREELIEQADRAMYEAKIDGRDCIRIADVQHPPGRETTSSPPTLAHPQLRI